MRVCVIDLGVSFMLTAGKSKPARLIKLCIAFLFSIALLCMLQLVIAYETSLSASAAETNKNILDRKSVV